MDYRKTYYYMAALVGLFLTVYVSSQLLSQFVEIATQLSSYWDGQFGVFVRPLLNAPLIIFGALIWYWHFKKAESIVTPTNSIKVFYYYLVAAVSLLSAVSILLYSSLLLFPLLITLSSGGSLFIWQAVFVLAVPFAAFVGVWYWHLSKANKFNQ